MLESLLDILLESGESLILMPVFSFDSGKSNLWDVGLGVPMVGESELDLQVRFGKSSEFLPTDGVNHQIIGFGSRHKYTSDRSWYSMHLTFL